MKTVTLTHAEDSLHLMRRSLFDALHGLDGPAADLVRGAILAAETEAALALRAGAEEAPTPPSYSTIKRQVREHLERELDHEFDPGSIHNLAEEIGELLWPHVRPSLTGVEARMEGADSLAAFEDAVADIEALAASTDSTEARP